MIGQIIIKIIDIYAIVITLFPIYSAHIDYNCLFFYNFTTYFCEHLQHFQLLSNIFLLLSHSSFIISKINNFTICVPITSIFNLNFS